MAVSARIEALVGFVPPDSIVADIGCDHGYLCEQLLLRGFPMVYAVDISEPSLQKAKTLLHGFQNRCIFRVGDGLTVLENDKIDCCVIAGMGAQTIIQILSHPKAAQIPVWVLQPLRNSEILRAFLNERYTIAQEKLVWQNGRVYECMQVVPGQERAYSPAELYVGRRNIEKQSPLLLRLAQKKLKHLLAVEKSGERQSAVQELQLLVASLGAQTDAAEKSRS